MPPNFEHLKTCCYWPHTCLQVLGALGLGCKIWMDGMEITQFTYFQQVWFLISTSWNVYFLRVATLTLRLHYESYLNFMSNFFSLSLSLSLSRVGSLQLSPISIEITYGLERLFMLLLVNFITFFIFLLFCFFFNLPKFIQVRSAGCWSFEENSVCWWDNIWGAFLGKWFNFFTFFFSEYACSFSLSSCFARFIAAHWFSWET